jgi:hypothetical protein
MLGDSILCKIGFLGTEKVASRWRKLEDPIHHWAQKGVVSSRANGKPMIARWKMSSTLVIKQVYLKCQEIWPCQQLNDPGHVVSRAPLVNGAYRSNIRSGSVSQFYFHHISFVCMQKTNALTRYGWPGDAGDLLSRDLLRRMPEMMFYRVIK